MARSIVVLGSTGSIGTQALQIVAANPDQFQVLALTCGGADIPLLVEQVVATNARVVGIANQDRIADFVAAFTALAPNEPIPAIEAGPTASATIAAMQCDVVLNGITGSVGLPATIAALEAGSTLALANKESLVVGGAVVTRLAGPDQIVPVDSEHSALAQCLRGGRAGEVRQLVLTASGGPFRGYTAEQLQAVTLADALDHPTWDMGPVVTINSATLVNKGLEVIEAHLLFGIEYQRIATVVHPQSVVHSMVEFVDGSTLAQVSPPDMRLPIALGLAWPDRIPNAAPACDWNEAATWTFEPLDSDVFPGVRLARQAGQAAGTAPAVFNAANEQAVAGFLAGTVSFTEIVEVIERVLDRHLGSNGESMSYVADESLTVEAVLSAEQWAREAAQEVLAR